MCAAKPILSIFSYVLTLLGRDIMMENWDFLWWVMVHVRAGNNKREKKKDQSRCDKSSCI